MSEVEVINSILDIQDASGIETDEFLKLINIDNAEWVKIIAKTRSIGLSEIIKISDFFNIKIDYLLKGIVDLTSISKRFHNPSFTVEKIRTKGSQNLCALNLGKKLCLDKIANQHAN